MNVLNVVAAIDPHSGGGTAERTYQMTRYLRKEGVYSGILTTDCGIVGEIPGRREGIEIIALPCLSKRFYIPKLSLVKLRKLIESADIVHLMNHWTFINSIIYMLVRMKRKPYVVCAAGALPVFGRSKILKFIYNFVVGKKIITNANACIAITNEEYADYRRYGVGDSRIVCIPNGIDTDVVNVGDSKKFREKYNLGDVKFILFLGRLNTIKGPDMLLRAYLEIAKEFTDYNLVVAGPDEGMLRDLQRVTIEAQLEDKVHLIGSLEKYDKYGAYKAASIVVIPSRQEAMSIVVLEAGILGKPVVVTDRCGVNHLGNIEAVKIVKANHDSIQEGIRELLSVPATMKRLGDRKSVV